MQKKYLGNFGNSSIIKDQSLINHEAIKQQILILDELRDLIPPLQEEESAQLEKNILAEGCREALLIWETTKNVLDESITDTSAAYVLVDGHNRYGICQKHKINFKIHLISFASLKEVRDYMIDNQLGRRNLIPEQASYLRGLRYNSEKIEKGKYNREEYKGQNVPYGNSTKKESTSARLSKQYNVSEKTIKRDAEFAEGLNLLAPELKKDILAGRIKAKKSDIQQLSQITSPSNLINSLEEVANLVAPTSQKNIVDISESEEQSILKKRIQEIAKQLTNSATKSLCEELIQLSSSLKDRL